MLLQAITANRQSEWFYPANFDLVLIYIFFCRYYAEPSYTTAAPVYYAETYTTTTYATPSYYAESSYVKEAPKYYSAPSY